VIFKPTATVIGSGIQGCTIALQLLRKGYKIRLIEQSPDIYQRASLNQEGKIHLGFIYALDQSGRTTSKMLADALMFAPILETLIQKKIDWEQIKSHKFHYLVARDSMVSPDFLNQHYALVENGCQNLLKDKGLHYLGKRPETLYSWKKATSSMFSPEIVEAVFTTEEYAIDPVQLRQLLVEEIRLHERITIYPSHRVVDISQLESGYNVTCRFGNDTVQLKSDIVINAAWDGKRQLDQLMGINDDQAWSHRLKFSILFPAPSPQDIPSFSVVQGSYGDYVCYPAGKSSYFSWYPVCMTEQRSDISIPDRWQSIVQGTIDQDDYQHLINESLIALRNLIPGIRVTGPYRLRAGTILARGHRSITDPTSEFHQRADPPYCIYQGYFSVNTGKFTSAPRNSYRLMELI
jgi:glycine/D-amino acid oxidase-like deaminating enzyme